MSDLNNENSNELPVAGELDVMGIYLYCLTTTAFPPKLSGLLDGEIEVSTFRQGGVVAVYVDIDPAEFSIENLQSVSWVGPRAQQHEAVVAKVMRSSTVLPVKFGAIFTSISKLQEFLLKHHQVITQALESLEGKGEYNVKVFIDEDDVKSAIVKEDSVIRNQIEKFSTSPGTRYMQEKKMEAAIASASDIWIEKQLEEVIETLNNCSEASTVLRCHSKKVTGRSDLMILNRSFLLSPELIEPFHIALSKLQTDQRNISLHFESSGPWPLFNFCPSLL